MMYQGIELSKRESEVVLFLQTGSHNFWDAYSNYNSRKKRIDRPTLTVTSWFNYTIKGLHAKKLFEHIPFVYLFREHKTGPFKYIWMNPGINASKANFQALTLHDAVMESKSEINKII